MVQTFNGGGEGEAAERSNPVHRWEQHTNTSCVASLNNYPIFTHYCEVDHPVRSTVLSAQFLPQTP